MAHKDIIFDFGEDKRVGELVKIKKADTGTNQASAANSSRFIDFKEALKNRLKKKRHEARKEEEEEKDIDEEFQNKLSPQKPNDQKSEPSKSKKDEDFSQHESGESSDEDFKLNLIDDIEEGNNYFRSRHAAKIVSSDEESNEISSHSVKKSKVQRKNANDSIPSTNTIPSNQLTKNSGVANSNEGKEDLMVSQTFLATQLKRPSLDDLTNISLNLDITSNNSVQLANSNLNLSEGILNNSKHDYNNGTQENGESMIFDEIAFLCSGQFKIDKPPTNNQNLISDNIVDEVFEDDDDTTSTGGSGGSSSKAKIDEKNEEKESSLSGEEESMDEEIAQPNNFFDEEAELSGSETGSDDLEEDDDEDDDSIIYKGEDGDLPSDDELKDQLGKFYLKDQIDEDKRQIRILKEQFLANNEFASKNSRRKQFKWENLDKNRFPNWRNDSSSDEENLSDNEASEEKNSSVKSPSFQWRSMRFERNAFVDSKLKDEWLNEQEDLLQQTEEKEISEFELPSSTNIFKRGKDLLKKNLESDPKDGKKNSWKLSRESEGKPGAANSQIGRFSKLSSYWNGSQNVEKKPTVGKMTKTHGGGNMVFAFVNEKKSD